MTTRRRRVSTCPMWPDTPMAVERLFRADWCRRIPPVTVVLGRYCSAELFLDDKRRHRCRMADSHTGPHTCWCGRAFSPGAGQGGTRFAVT